MLDVPFHSELFLMHPMVYQKVACISRISCRRLLAPKYFRLGLQTLKGKFLVIFILAGMQIYTMNRCRRMLHLWQSMIIVIQSFSPEQIAAHKPRENTVHRYLKLYCRIMGFRLAHIWSEAMRKHPASIQVSKIEHFDIGGNIKLAYRQESSIPVVLHSLWLQHEKLLANPPAGMLCCH